MLVEEPHSHGAAQAHVDLKTSSSWALPGYRGASMSQSLAEVSFLSESLPLFSDS